MTNPADFPDREWSHGYDGLLTDRARHALARKVSLGVQIDPSVLRLNWGMSDPDTLPAEETIEAVAATLRDDLPSAMEYDFPQGDPLLRQVLADRLSGQNGVTIAPDQITLNGGSSLSLDNLCRAVLEPGDVVIAEDPAYPGTLHHYRLADADIEGVGVDGEGMRTDILAERIERLRRDGRRVKVIHTIPDFQNPTGLTLSLRRRKELLAVAAHYGVLVVEDQAYRDLYFGEAPPTSLFALARGEGVVQLGTFAKTWATGIRIGWALASPELAPAIAATHTEAGISSILTGAMRRIVASGRMDVRILEQREELRSRRDAAIAALRKYGGETVRFETPGGGYFLWLQLPEGTDARQCVVKAGERRVMLLHGAPFYVDHTARPFLRVAYSYLGPRQLDEAIRLLCEAIDEVLGASVPKR